jgi:hypothetical protein
MYLHHHPHRGEKPAIILIARHPTRLQVEEVFDQALHRLYRIAPLLVESLMLFLLEHFYHALAFWAFVSSLARGGQQEDPALPLSLEKQLLLISLAVHEHRRNQSVQLARLQPHPFGFVCTIAHPLERPQYAILTGHHTERPVAIDPAVALALTPGRLGGQPCQAVRDDAWLLLLAMPDRATRPDHHLVGADHVSARMLVEQFDKGILRLFQAESRFFSTLP